MGEERRRQILIDHINRTDGHGIDAIGTMEWPPQLTIKGIKFTWQGILRKPRIFFVAINKPQAKGI